jgi:hypothetical protein
LLVARQAIRPLLDDSNPAEAPTAYYALFHPPHKSLLFVQHSEQGRALGFVGRFQTGFDLFRPLISLKVPRPEIAAALLSQALAPGRPYLLFASLNQLAMVGGSLDIQQQSIFRIYLLDPSRFQPQMNILVQQKQAPDGLPRCEIRAGDKAVAVAGVNWRSPAFAEVYLQQDSQARQKNWGRSVLGTLSSQLLGLGLRPIYLLDTHDEAGRALIESLGYVDTGSRQVQAEVTYLGQP